MDPEPWADIVAGPVSDADSSGDDCLFFLSLLAITSLL